MGGGEAGQWLLFQIGGNENSILSNSSMAKDIIIFCINFKKVERIVNVFPISTNKHLRR